MLNFAVSRNARNFARRLAHRQTKTVFIDYRGTLPYNYRVIFEWDDNKAKSNLRKHKIGFDEAETVFSDPSVITFADEFHSLEEERFISIGLSNVRRILLVVHTEVFSNDNEVLIRIISCRRATLLEQKIYEEQF